MSAPSPRLAIIGGSGALGSALARRWADAGFDVVLGSRSREKGAAAAAMVSTRRASAIRGDDNLAAAEGADIVVLAVPFSSHDATLDEIRHAVQGKIVVDAVVPLVPPKVSRVHIPPGVSAAERAQQRLGDGVRVVAAFHNLGAEKLRAHGPIECDVLVFGDDRAARDTVIDLVTAAGARGVDGGPIANAVAAEALTPVLIGINRRYKLSDAGIRITGMAPAAAPRPATNAGSMAITAVAGLPLFEPGDDLAGRLIESLRADEVTLRDYDIVVLAQKIVSKCEGRYVDLAEVTPSPRAHSLAAVVQKDARMVEVILSESDEVVRYREGVLIVAHRLGFVMANGGVDQSNIEQRPGGERVLLLPENPDASCAAIKARLDEAFGVDVAVVINDSFGRPWRNGVVGVAIGCAGLPALVDEVGQPDLFGRAMRVTEVALADEVAAAASLLMGQTNAGLPAVHVRGLEWKSPARPASALVRPKTQDMFR